MIKTFENFNQDDFYVKVDATLFKERAIIMPINIYSKLEDKLSNNGFICEYDRDIKNFRLKATNSKKMVLFISSFKDEYYEVTYWIGDGDIEKYICDQLDGLYKLLYDKGLIKEI